MLKYKGSNYLRQRLVLSTLSTKPTRIENIREDNEQPGLREHEASLIRMFDKLTNGSRIEINETGTRLDYYPGLLQGGVLEHDCSKERGIGYFLEAVFMLAPFAKQPLKLTLRGNTSGPNDLSVDYYKMAVVPMLKQMITCNSEDLDIKVIRRGFQPDGEGEVVVMCPVVRRMKPIRMLDDSSKVKRVRGLVYCQRVNPGVINRVVEAARGVLNNYLPDVYIYTDWIKGQSRSSGYGLVLVSEGVDGTRHAAERACYSSDILPEDLGKETAEMLMQDIVMGGCTGSHSQIIPLLFMTLGHYDVSKVVLGQLTNNTIEFLRHLRDYLQVVFKIESQVEYILDEKIERERVTLTCIGTGYSNVGKPNK